MADAMKDTLKQILQRNSIADTVVANFVTLQCLTVEDFANWVDKREDLKVAFIDQTDQKDVPAQTARIKMAWRQAEAVVQKGLKRTSEGLSEEPLDEPLDETVRISVLETFTKAWNWPNLPLVRMGTDVLLGRVFREFQSKKPTLYPVAKVKSLASVQAKVGGVAKRRLGDRITMCFDGQDEDDLDNVGTVLEYFTSLEVLGNTWAVAGAFEVMYLTKPCKYASWPDIYAYNVEIKEQAITKIADHSEQSVLRYVTSVEEELRVKAIGLARGEEVMPWGKALSTVIKEHSSIWDHKADLLVKRRAALSLTPGPGNGRQRQQPRGGPPAIEDASGNLMRVKKEGKDSEWKKGWATARYDQANNTICKAWNDTRGCKKDCPKHFVHVCDILLSTNKLCGSKQHNRLNHKVADHGMPKKGY